MHTSLWRTRQKSSFWQSPSGIAQLAWEQQILDTFNERIFGYYALTVELHTLNLLNHSSIANILRLDPATGQIATPTSLFATINLQAWPIHSDSLDYIVLPHVLEFSDDPHAVLREAARCLRPGGYLSITAFNPHSLLGLQAAHLELGHRHNWLTRGRLIDWLQLLNLQADRGAFGQWRPMCHQAKHFQRLAWLDPAGERWWPHGANVFALRMVKQVAFPIHRPLTQPSDSLLDKVLRPAMPPASAIHTSNNKNIN